MSRGLVPRVSGEGRIGRSDKPWGSVWTNELRIGGVLFDPEGAVVDEVTDDGAGTVIDLSNPVIKLTPTADTTYTFTHVAAERSKVLIVGDSNEYTINFGAIKWNGLRPNQLVNGKSFLFEFVSYGVGVGNVYGTFLGTVEVHGFGIIPKGTDLTITDSVDSYIVSRRSQILDVHFLVDSGSETALEFDVRVNSASIYTTTPKINTGHLTSAETALGVLDRTMRVLEVGDYVEFDVVQRGNPTIAEGLKVEITQIVL